VIDSEPQRAAGIEAIVRFLEHDVTLLPYEGDFSAINDGGHYALALLAAEGNQGRWQRALSALGDEAPTLPVFLLAPPGIGRVSNHNACASVLGTLELPLRQAQFAATLRQALSLNAEGWAQATPSTSVPRLVDQSWPMQQIQHLIEQVAGSDVNVLIEELVRRMEEEGSGSVRFSPAALSQLSDLPERLLSQSSIESTSMEAPAPVGRLSAVDWKAGGINLREFLAAQEAGLIRQALDEAEGVVAQAAKLLGLRRTTLVEKLRRYGIRRTEVELLD
jgi:DNA-binding NtrC family response regulator